MHSMSKAPLLIGTVDGHELDHDHPCWNNLANNPYNGWSWNSDEGVKIDEAAYRMSMITEYASFEPSSSFRQILDAAAQAARPTDDIHNDWWGYGYELGLEAQRDLALACMGL